jgi:hypothetical protein
MGDRVIHGEGQAISPFEGDAQGRLARPDLVAVPQVRRLLNLLPVDERVVRAAHVHEPAIRRVHFDHEVDAGEILVLVREAEMRSLRPADDEGVVPFEVEHFPFMGASRNGQAYTHGGVSCSTRGVRSMADLNYALSPGLAQG